MAVTAVLFDFDGVLADTENAHVVAWERTFARMGWAVPPEACARAAEVDDRDFLRDLFAERQVADGDVAGWVGRKQALTRQLLADAPWVYPGVPALLERLARGGARLAVVSGTWRENVEAVLAPLGLRAAFDLVVAKEDVAAPKPDPEAYRVALARLGLPAGQVVALEDSPTGLAAARAAGVPVVAVGHRRPSGEWAEGAPFLPDLADLPRALEALGRPDLIVER
jgi:HAD superfamily hydrolase (TIGR01509 family)